MATYKVLIQWGVGHRYFRGGFSASTEKEAKGKFAWIRESWADDREGRRGTRGARPYVSLWKCVDAEQVPVGKEGKTVPAGEYP